MDFGRQSGTLRPSVPRERRHDQAEGNTEFLFCTIHRDASYRENPKAIPVVGVSAILLQLPISQQNGRLSMFYVPDSDPLQIGGADRHCGTVAHVVDKDVNAASHVSIRDSALPNDIGHRGIFIERGEATSLPRRFRRIRNLQLLWNRLIIIRARRCCLAFLDD
jgi:hypothetical protein